MPSRTVLLDMTPLQTPHRFRGIGRYVQDLAKGLARELADRPRDVRVVGLAWAGLDGEVTLLEDVGEPTRIVVDDELAWAEPRVRWARRILLARIAKRVGASLVHLPDPRATPWMGPRRIVTCHDLIPLRFAQHYLDWRDGYAALRRFRDRRRFGGAHRVIAISHETKDDLANLLHVPEGRIRVVHNGIDLERFRSEPAPAERSLLASRGLDKPYVLYVGPYEWRKNPETMLDAMARVRREVDVELAWAGKMGADEERALRSLADQHGVGRALRLLGYVPDDELGVLYRQSIAHLFISRAEGFGLTILEAMASGAPVITSRGGALAEVAGDVARLVDPEDARAVGEAILELTRQPELRAGIVARGIDRVKAFSLGHLARGTLSVYEEALALD